MPVVSKKQGKFMQAVANSPKFAKKVGVKQSIGREFTKEKDMKKAVKKMNMGGRAMNDRDGSVAMDPKMQMAMAAQQKRAAMGGMKKGGKVKKPELGQIMLEDGTIIDNPNIGGPSQFYDSDEKRAATRKANIKNEKRINKQRKEMGLKAGGKVKKNTAKMNNLEELGRVDAEKGYTKKGKKNLKSEKKRLVSQIKKGYKAGGKVTADMEGRAMAAGKLKGSPAKMADARGRAMGKAAKMKRQGANSRLDESLGMRRGKEATKSQSMKSRRDESRGMKTGGMLARTGGSSAKMKAKGKKMMGGGKVKAYKKGGAVKGRGNASKRADGIAQRGHTRGRHV